MVDHLAVASLQGIPEEADNALCDLNDRDEEIRDIGFTPDESWIVLYGSNGFIRSGLPAAVEDAVTELHDDGSEIKQVSFAPDGSWVILFDSNGYWASELP